MSWYYAWHSLLFSGMCIRVSMATECGQGRPLGLSRALTEGGVNVRSVGQFLKVNKEPPLGHHMISQHQPLMAIPSAPPPTFNTTLHVPVSVDLSVSMATGPHPHGPEKALVALLWNGGSHPLFHTALIPTPPAVIFLAETREWIPPPTPTLHHPISFLTTSVCSYRLIWLVVLAKCAHAHLAWRSHCNAEHTECACRSG